VTGLLEDGERTMMIGREKAAMTMEKNIRKCMKRL
jgi:hypothetical protein